MTAQRAAETPRAPARLRTVKRLHAHRKHLWVAKQTRRAKNKVAKQSRKANR